MIELISIKLRDIPAYLQAGEFYRNLDYEGPDGTVEIPADCFHATGVEIPTNLDEYQKLLQVTTFWMLDEIPSGILDFCFLNESPVWEPTTQSHTGMVESSMLSSLLSAYSTKGVIPFVSIVKTKRWDIMTHSAGLMDRNNMGTVVAAGLGNLDLLRYMEGVGFLMCEGTCIAAAESGHLDCLQFANSRNCPWDNRAFQYAALNGHLHCLKYCHEQGLDWHPDTCRLAAKNGHLECLKYAHENGCPWDSDVHKVAAEEGHLHCMQYAFQEGLHLPPEVCTYSARWAHLNCLQFAHECECPWDADTVTCAAHGGYDDCLRYALEHDCPHNEAASYLACQHGHLVCLQLLHQFDALWNEQTALCATEASSLDCLQYLHENGCPWDERTPQQAAIYGHLEALQYALERGCPHCENLLQWAAIGGDQACLQYLIEYQLLVMDEATFKIALLRGDLNCVQYLIDIGCHYRNAKFESSVEQIKIYDERFKVGNPEFALCLTYALERGWHMTSDFKLYLAEKDFENCREILQFEGWFTDGEENVVNDAKIRTHLPISELGILCLLRRYDVIGRIVIFLQVCLIIVQTYALQYFARTFNHGQYLMTLLYMLGLLQFMQIVSVVLRVLFLVYLIRCV